MRSTLSSAIGLACLALTLASCSKSEPTKPPAAPPTQAQSTSSKPKDLVVGKWQRTDPGKTDEKMELTADGTISGDSGGFPYKGKYTFVDENTIQYELKPDLGDQMLTKCKVKVTKDELTLDIVDAKTRAKDDAKWQSDDNSKARISQVEKYKRVP
jgi:hypothetical protein